MNKGIIVLAAVAALFLVKKGAAAAPAPLPPLGGPPDTATDEQDTYALLSKTLEADNVWIHYTFPVSFYDAVELAHEQALSTGQARDPAYNYGLPGAFMSVADAWMGAMHYNQTTHTNLWNIYNAFRTRYESANSLSNG